MNMITDGHLGGFIKEGDPATFTPGLWRSLCVELEIKSVIDVGCGMGYALIEFNKYCTDILGLDGCRYVLENSDMKSYIQEVDFCKGKPNVGSYDLCWSSEFVEHVEEKYMNNFLDIFCASKYLAITYADVGQEGHHHVNCQPKEYWISVIEKMGMIYDENSTNRYRNIAKADGEQYNPIYKNNHFSERGLFFRKK